MSRPLHEAGSFPPGLGLVPKQYSTGGKVKLLGISKRGNQYLRRLFIHGSRSVLAHVDRKTHLLGDWINGLENRVHRNVAAVALENKLARIAWAVLCKGEAYLCSKRKPDGYGKTLGCCQA